ncbi:uncharacterized protein K452DRAFT_301138 [Aplosporella prunicola CBS 121167]|uniref:Cytochrome P450 n=1 Tax=Aplosporella prunicola CBS 121167 TaxID=1176127 RepID=A0A6A6B6K8_9PEZI|nr:uncharacterized protein K452DRAFT_301138 [Aplosporella prunicola CBS 121167]KAF2138617.1 hypothetical protein K452DRAFT_301138 [Aplosporella prunicola CBS 121167]
MAALPLPLPLPLPLLCLGAWLAYFLLRSLYNIYLHPLRHIPGPRLHAATRLPFWISLARGRQHLTTASLHARYGPVVRLSPADVSFAAPGAIAGVHSYQRRLGGGVGPPLPRSRPWSASVQGVPESLTSVVDFREHGRLRGAFLPAFTERALLAQEPLVQGYVDLLVERLRQRTGPGGGVVDIVPWYTYTTFDIIGDLAVGESFGCLEGSRLHKWVEGMTSTINVVAFLVIVRTYPLLERVLSWLVPQSMLDAAKLSFAETDAKVRKRLALPAARPDFLTPVLAEQRAGKEPLTQEEMAANLNFFLIAGSETTATALTGITNYLVHSPAALATLTAEVRAAFSSQGDISIAATRALPYLNAVVSEGLRLCPPVAGMIPRVTPPGGAVVCGVPLPAGVTVNVAQWALFRSAAYWHRADEFVPERWLRRAREDSADPFFGDAREALQPFTEGPRACLGKWLALAEIRVVLAKMVWAFEMERAGSRKGDVKWERQRVWLVVEKEGFEVRLRARRG